MPKLLFRSGIIRLFVFHSRTPPLSSVFAVRRRRSSGGAGPPPAPILRRHRSSAGAGPPWAPVLRRRRSSVGAGPPPAPVLRGRRSSVGAGPPPAPILRRRRSLDPVSLRCFRPLEIPGRVLGATATGARTLIRRSPASRSAQWLLQRSNLIGTRLHLLSAHSGTWSELGTVPRIDRTRAFPDPLTHRHRRHHGVELRQWTEILAGNPYIRRTFAPTI
jgi:hypothetical protein